MKICFGLIIVFWIGIFKASEVVITADNALLKTASLALHRSKQWNKVPFLYKKYGITQEDIVRTIAFIQTILRQDMRESRKYSRMHELQFLEKNFEWISIIPDKEQAVMQRKYFPPGVKDVLDSEFLITKYASFKLQGSLVKTELYSYALYASYDYEKKKLKTKKEILDGALDEYPELYKPLVWVTKKGLEKALMQGSIIVSLPDGKDRLFNVHMHNGYEYMPGVSVDNQNRYWFFKEIVNEGAVSLSHVTHILDTEYASFAADICYFGMGTLLTMQTHNPLNKRKQRVLGFVLDTGGAFRDNRYQVDLFVGLCEDDFVFQEKIKSLAEHGVVHMLIKKRG